MSNELATSPNSNAKPTVEVRWHNAARHSEEVEVAARIAAGIVFEQAQASVLGPAVARPRAHLGLAAGSDEGGDSVAGCVPTLGTPEHPLSYVDLAKHWTWTGFSPAEMIGRREPERAELPASDLLRRDKLQRKAVRGRRSIGERKDWRQVNPQVRPGRGGRRPKQQPTIRSAAQELLESLGEPELVTHKGAHVMIWDARAAESKLGVDNGLIDPAGRGMAFARLSGDEVQKGENLGYHVQVALDLARKEGVAVRWVMASLENSGFQWFDERKDLLRIERLIELGQLDQISMLHLHRMARGRLEIEQVCRLLQVGNVDLYIAAINRKIDWHLDDGLIASWAMTASQEGKWIKERTHGAIIRRFLLEGRGWPGAIRYGCVRDENKYLVEDPAQMQVVHWLFERYIEIAADGGKGGLRRLRAELAGSPFATQLSYERIRTILMDPLYVTGEWHVTYADYAIACKPVEFSDPIPEQTFQRVQELLSLRGKANSVTPLGHFLLNYIPFYHATCAGQRAPKGKRGRIMLRGELKDKGEEAAALTYRHRPHCPKECRGMLIPKAEIEAAVVREVKRLLRTRVFRAAAAQARAAAADEGNPLQDEESRQRAQTEELRKLRQSLARVEQTEKATKRRWLDGIGNGSAGAEDWEEMLGEIRTERKRLGQLITLAEKQGRGAPRRRRRIAEADRDGYLDSVDKILTEETPDDPDHRIARAALIKALLSAVVLRDMDRDGGAPEDGGDEPASPGYKLELYGWLVPDDEQADEAPDALLHLKDKLDRFASNGHAGLADDAMAENEDVGPGGSVKQAEACLTQPQARELAQYLERQARVPAEFDKAKVRTGVTLPKGIVEPEDLEHAAFKDVFHVPGPLPQPDVAAAESEDALVRFSALVAYADVGRAALTQAAWQGRLREFRIGDVRYGTRRWLREYEESRHRGQRGRLKRRRPVQLPDLNA